MVTGLLYIELNFYPGTPATLVGLPSPYPELPTIPTTMEELFASVRQIMDDLSKLPVQDILNEIAELLRSVNGIVTAPQMNEALADIGSILQKIDEGVGEALIQLPQLVEKAGGTADTATATLEVAQQLLRHVDGQVAPLASGANATMRSARSTLDQGRQAIATLEQAVKPAVGDAQRALAGVADVLGADSMVLHDVSKTLVALEEAARSIRSLANYLERNPQALLRGKGRAGGQ
jgi:paraquat-inducible protein B